MFCPSCGQENPDTAVTCQHCGRPTPMMAPTAYAPGGVAYSSEAANEFASKKIAAGVCGILLGSLGVHKFILGLTTPGIIMLLVTILTCGFGAMVTHVIGLVEGIIYLTKSDAEFYRVYGVEKKGWF